MKHTGKFLAAASVLTLSAAANVSDAQAEKMEKCYGVVKAGKNDCGNKSGTHSCAAQAKEDGSADEFILLPAGICDRLVNGSNS